MEFVEGKDIGFWAHVKSVFNTEQHPLSLFLHPLCWTLAISQAAKSWTFEDHCKITLEIAQRWGWSSNTASQLLDDLKQYHLCKGLFIGGKADGKKWWEELSAKGSQHPLKIFTIQILLIVPHTAEVEQLFSNLGSIQSVKCCNLTVENLHKLGKLCGSYTYHIQEQNQHCGISNCWKYAHMHTHLSLGSMSNSLMTLPRISLGHLHLQP